MKRALLVLLLVASAAFGQGPALKLPSEVKGLPGAFIRIPAETNGKLVSWSAIDAGLNLFPVELLKDTRTAVVTAPVVGRYRLVAFTALGDAPSSLETCWVIVGDAPPPIPPGPVPPGPVPPGPAPIPGDGLRVLIVYETAETLPLPQNSILYSKAVRDWLNAKCATGPDGKTREWRIYDKDVDLAGEAKIWQDAMKRPRQSVPWIVVSNGRAGFEGPLPATVDATLELLQKYVPATKKAKKSSLSRATVRSQPYIFLNR